MYVHTKFENLNDKELLNHLESIRYHSPIIAELCKRLEESMKEPDPLRDRVDCPVCQANLIVDVDESIDSYQLKIAED